MDKSLKIVLIAIAIYTVLSFQFLIEKGFWLIPYNYNPLTFFMVSLAITIQSYKQKAFRINLIYLIGITFYSLLSERTLNLLKLYFNPDFFDQIINNPFVRLIAVLGFSISIIYILILYIKQQPKNWFILFIFLLAFILGLLNFKLLNIITFNLFVILFYILLFFDKKASIKDIFMPVSIQLLIFILFENLFFYFN